MISAIVSVLGDFFVSINKIIESLGVTIRRGYSRARSRRGNQHHIDKTEDQFDQDVRLRFFEFKQRITAQTDAAKDVDGRCIQHYLHDPLA